jgi:DNA gyrase subunit B
VGQPRHNGQNTRHNTTRHPTHTPGEQNPPGSKRPQNRQTVKASVVTADFVHGADYEALSKAGITFKGLLGADAIVKRGEGERAKETPTADFRAAMAWLMTQAESSVSRQRYKGLGEMNPAQLWETTMDPAVRRLLRVQIEDAIEADRVFTMLMGDEVEPRRDFIETNALRAANIDA